MTSIITDRPIVFGADGKIQRLDSGGKIEVGTVQGVDDLTLNPGYAGRILATTRDGYFAIDGYSTSTVLGLNEVIGLQLRSSTPATVEAPHKNPPIINNIGQYYIGGNSVYRSLGKFGAIVSEVDGSNEVVQYSFVWGDNDGNIKWQANDDGTTYQDGDLEFNPTYSATINSVKRINAAAGSSLFVGFVGLTKMEVSASDVSLFSDDGYSYLRVTDIGDVYARVNSTQNLTLSNIDVAAGSYPAMTTSWSTPVVIEEFDGLSFLLNSTEADGSKASRMYMLNKLTYDSGTYAPDGGDITIETSLDSTTGIESVIVNGGNINLLTSIERDVLPSADAGKILLESQNQSHGIIDYSLRLKSSGSVLAHLGEQDGTDIADSSMFIIKKDIDLNFYTARMMALQTSEAEDYVEIFVSKDLNTTMPAEIGSFALDKNGGKAWIRTGANWERLATESLMLRAESLYIPIPWDEIDTPEYGDVVILGGDLSDGYGTVVPAIANYQIANVQGIAVDDGYIQIMGIATIKTETFIQEGEEVFLSNTNAGYITNIPPDILGSSVVSIGDAVDDSDGYYCRVLLNIKDPIYVATTSTGTVNVDEILEANTIFVMKNGDDDTGTRGDRTKPFLTIAAAFDVAQSGDLVLVGPGTFSESGLIIPDVSQFHLKGAGIGLTTISLDSNRIVRNTNSPMDVLTLSHFTLDRGAGLGVLLDGDGYGGYFASDLIWTYCVVSYVEDISVAPDAWDLGWSLISCGNIRFENCIFRKNCGLVKIKDHIRTDINNCYFYGTSSESPKSGFWITNTTGTGICVMNDCYCDSGIVRLLDNTQFSVNGLFLNSLIEISPSDGDGDVDGFLYGKYVDSTVKIGYSSYANQVNVKLDNFQDGYAVKINALEDLSVVVNIRNSSISNLEITSDGYTATAIDVDACQSCLPTVSIVGEGPDGEGNFACNFMNCTILNPTVTGPHTLYAYGGVIYVVNFVYSGSAKIRHYENNMLNYTDYPVV